METARLAEPQRSFRIGLRYGSFLTGRSAAALRAGPRFPASGLVAKAPARSLAASNQRNSASLPHQVPHGHPCPTSATRGLVLRQGEPLLFFSPWALDLRPSYRLAHGATANGRGLPCDDLYLHCQLSTENCPLAASASFHGLRLCWPKGPLGRLRRSSLRASMPYARMPSGHRGRHCDIWV